MNNLNEWEGNYDDQIASQFSDSNENEQINSSGEGMASSPGDLDDFERYFEIIFPETSKKIVTEDEIDPYIDPSICPIVFNEVNVVSDEEDEIIENIVIEIQNKPKEKIEEKPNLIECEKIKKNEKPSQFFIFSEGSGKVFLNKKRFIIDEKNEITDIKSNNYNSDNLSQDSEKIHTKKKRKEKKNLMI